MEKKNNDNFRMLFDRAPLGYQSLDIDGNFLEVNQKWCDTLGYERDEVIGKWFGHFLRPAYQNGFRERFPIFKAQGHIHSEFEMLHKNGKILFIAFEGQIGHNEDGSFKQTHCILEDITERKQAEIALQESEEKFRTFFEAANVGKSITSLSGEVHINKAFCEMLGYTEEELKNKKWQEITPPEDIDYNQKEIDPLIKGEKSSVRFVKRYIHKNGSLIWADVSSRIHNNQQNEPSYFITTVIDITEQKIAEEKLRQTLTMLRTTFDQSPVGSVVVGLDKRFQKCNDAFCRFIGYSEAELIGKTIAEITHPDDVNLGMNELKLMAEGKIDMATVEKRYVRKDGLIVWGQISISIVRDTNSKPMYFLPVIQDISDRKRVENELRESEERFKALHNASFGGIAIHDKGIILECNVGLSQMTGYSLDELIGMDGLLLIAPGSRDKVLSNIIAGSEKPYESLGLRKNGEIYSITLEARNVHYKGKSVRTVEFRDITEIKKAEETIKKRIEDLESFQKLIVGRELKMIELKREVNELLKAMGKDEKYDS